MYLVGLDREEENDYEIPRNLLDPVVYLHQLENSRKLSFNNSQEVKEFNCDDLMSSFGQDELLASSVVNEGIGNRSFNPQEIDMVVRDYDFGRTSLGGFDYPLKSYEDISNIRVYPLYEENFVLGKSFESNSSKPINYSMNLERIIWGNRMVGGYFPSQMSYSRDLGVPSRGSYQNRNRLEDTLKYYDFKRH